MKSIAKKLKVSESTIRQMCHARRHQIKFLSDKEKAVQHKFGETCYATKTFPSVEPMYKFS